MLLANLHPDPEILCMPIVFFLAVGIALLGLIRKMSNKDE
jgi:hypothetical protein